MKPLGKMRVAKQEHECERETTAVFPLLRLTCYSNPLQIQVSQVAWSRLVPSLSSYEFGGDFNFRGRTLPSTQKQRSCGRPRKMCTVPQSLHTAIH